MLIFSCASGAVEGGAVPSPGSVAQSPATEAKWRQLVAAAEAGNPDAQFVLAQAYERGDGVGQSYDKAFPWYTKAANAGHVPAQFFLGAMYASARGTPRDVAKAIYWYRKAAEKGYPDALYPMGYAYEYALGGLPRDYAEALSLV